MRGWVKRRAKPRKDGRLAVKTAVWIDADVFDRFVTLVDEDRKRSLAVTLALTKAAFGPRLVRRGVGCDLVSAEGSHAEIEAEREDGGAKTAATKPHPPPPSSKKPPRSRKSLPPPSSPPSKGPRRRRATSYPPSPPSLKTPPRSRRAPSPSSTPPISVPSSRNTRSRR